MLPGVEQRSLITRDGTRIGYQVRGDGPCVVLANGLGASHIAFKYLYDALAGYRTICWDYRGLYTSGAPRDRRANTIVHQVDDLIEILAGERVDSFALAGWSAGVQVGLETIRRHELRVRGLFAMNGTSAHTFSTVMGSRLIGHTIPMILRLVRLQAPLLGVATRRFSATEALIAMMKRTGLASETIDVALFREVVDEFRHTDWRTYSELLTRLDEHDAEAVLETVDIPVTLVAGARDRIIPASASEHMHRKIAGSRLVVIEGSSHYTPVEYPQILADELGRWLERIPGWGKREAA